jgi:pilus assembly protein CpaE
MDQIRTLVTIDNGLDPETVRSALPDDPEFLIVGIVQGVDDGWSTLQDTPTDLLVIACAGYSERTLFLIGAAAREHPGMPVVVLAKSSPDNFLRRVFEVGADDVVRLPEAPEQVGFTLHKVLARRRAAATVSGTALGPMICILGPKGGSGKTVTSSNLAVALAQAGKRVALIDLDLQFGDLALCMGIRPEKTIYDLAKSGGSLDAEKLDDYLVDHPSGVRLLVAPTRPDQASSIIPEFLRDVYATLRAMTDFVVVDSSPGFTPEVISAIDSSSYVTLVGMLDTLSLKNTRLGFETLELMGYEPDRILLLLNRADSRVGISDDDVLAVVGRRPDIRVPSDVEIPRAVNEGEPIVLARPGSEASKAFRQLADVFLRGQAGVPAPIEPAEQSENGSAPASRRRLSMRRR